MENFLDVHSIVAMSLLSLSVKFETAQLKDVADTGEIIIPLAQGKWMHGAGFIRSPNRRFPSFMTPATRMLQLSCNILQCIDYVNIFSFSQEAGRQLVVCNPRQNLMYKRYVFD